MMTLQKAKQRAFDRCNLIGEGVDIWRIMYQYKVICDLSEEEQDAVYDEIAEGLGLITMRG